MNDQIVPFKFDGMDIRVVNHEGEPWFVLADVCRALGLSADKGSYRHHGDKLDEDEKRQFPRSSLLGTPGLNTGVLVGAMVAAGVQFTNASDPLAVDEESMAWAVSESGLYTIILRSRGATTEGTVPHRFRRWVTSEVLPSVRKTGGYGKPAAPVDALAVLRDPAAMRGLLLEYTEKVLALEGVVTEKQAVIEEQAIKVDALNDLRGGEGMLCIRDASKVLSMSERYFVQWLLQSNWVYRRPGKGTLLAYSKLLKNGMLAQKIHATPTPDGSGFIEHPRVMITPKGIAHISVHIQRELKTDNSMFNVIPTDEEGGLS